MIVLCQRCVTALKDAVATLNLRPADAAKIEQAARNTLDGFVKSRKPPLPEDTCCMCFLHRVCTCGKGPDCAYATWATTAAVAAREELQIRGLL